FQKANVKFFQNQTIQSLSPEYLSIQNLNPISLVNTSSNLILKVEKYGEYDLTASFEKTDAKNAYLVLPWIYSKNYKLRTEGLEIQKSFHNLVQISIPKEITRGKIELVYEYPNKALASGIFMLAGAVYFMSFLYYRKKVKK
ncbi:MAG: hypothetical protein N3A69_01165, partial [Leptospiraceae bacterium]|nr:hypothetical protein [Leptospiraceae bacterium]